MEIYWAVKEMAKDLGFADSGCAAASEVSASVKDAYLYAKEAGLFAGMEYLHNNMEKRFNPQLLVDGADTVLVFLAPFSLPQGCTPPEGVSQYALGEDYHQVIKKKLFQIMEMLELVLE